MYPACAHKWFVSPTRCTLVGMKRDVVEIWLKIALATTTVLYGLGSALLLAGVIR